MRNFVKVNIKTVEKGIKKYNLTKRIKELPEKCCLVLWLLKTINLKVTIFPYTQNKLQAQIIYREFCQTCSRLFQSSKKTFFVLLPNMGFQLMTQRPRVGCSTEWASQKPLNISVLYKRFQRMEGGVNIPQMSVWWLCIHGK